MRMISVKAVMGSTQASVELDRRLKQKELVSLQTHDEELDGFFERIYEDNVSGKLSDDRFAKMSRRYEQEQKELVEKIKALRSAMDKLGSRAMTSDMFISTVQKYTRARKLRPRMLNELIERIEVHQAEKINGKQMGTEVDHPLQLCGSDLHSRCVPFTRPAGVREYEKRRSCQLRPMPNRHMIYKERRVFLQPFKCYKNTRHGADDGTRTRTAVGH